MENLPTLNLPIVLIAKITFLLVTIIYVIFTVVFYYHWQSYSVSKVVTFQTYLAYFIISLPLLLVMGLSVLAI